MKYFDNELKMKNRLKFIQATFLLTTILFAGETASRQSRPLDLFDPIRKAEFDKLERFEIRSRGNFDPRNAAFQRENSNGSNCTQHVVVVKEIVYEDQIRCNYVTYKNCFDAYKTVFKPQTNEVCREDFKTECDIVYEEVANAEIVRECSMKAERNCSVVGDKVCSTIYQTVCEAKYRDYNITNDKPNCNSISVQRCFNEPNGMEICRNVTTPLCKVDQGNKNQTLSEIECRRVPRQICRPENCPIKNIEVCEDKEKTFVTSVPKEICDIKPFSICTNQTFTLPILTLVNQCVDVPKEVCALEKVNPKQIVRPVIKNFCKGMANNLNNFNNFNNSNNLNNTNNFNNTNVSNNIKTSIKNNYKRTVNWHMIIGGNNGSSQLDTVELFNWKTKEQCQLKAKLPAIISKHSGTVYDGVPIICRGSTITGQKECYKFETKTRVWQVISNLNKVTNRVARAYETGEGQFYYGKYRNTLLKAEQISKPADFDTSQENDESESCVIQLNDTLTVILGGSEKPQGISYYDWSTQEYTVSPNNLIEGRQGSSCALFKGNDAETLVAIAGGRSQGMEVWNPATGRVDKVSEVLPSEEGVNSSLDYSQLLSINGGQDLLLYGGSQGGEPQFSIYKYSVNEKAWSLYGKMTSPRGELLVLPVPGVDCDNEQIIES